MFEVLIRAVGDFFRRGVAKRVEEACVAGAVDGMNAAAARLGMTAAPPTQVEVPALRLVYVEPDEDQDVPATKPLAVRRPLPTRSTASSKRGRK